MERLPGRPSVCLPRRDSRAGLLTWSTPGRESGASTPGRESGAGKERRLPARTGACSAFSLPPSLVEPGRLEAEAIRREPSPSGGGPLTGAACGSSGNPAIAVGRQDGVYIPLNGHRGERILTPRACLSEKRGTLPKRARRSSCRSPWCHCRRRACKSRAKESQQADK